MDNTRYNMDEVFTSGAREDASYASVRGDRQLYMLGQRAHADEFSFSDNASHISSGGMQHSSVRSAHNSADVFNDDLNMSTQKYGDIEKPLRDTSDYHIDSQDTLNERVPDNINEGLQDVRSVQDELHKTSHSSIAHNENTAESAVSNFVDYSSAGLVEKNDTIDPATRFRNSVAQSAMIDDRVGDRMATAEYVTDREKSLVIVKQRKNDFPVHYTLGNKEEENDNSGQGYWRTFFLKKLFPYFFYDTDTRSPFVTFATITFVVAVMSSGVAFVGNAFAVKDSVLEKTTLGYKDVTAGIENIKKQNFIAGARSFEESSAQFESAMNDVAQINVLIIELSRFLPKASELYAGRNVLVAADELSSAGKELSEIAHVVSTVENPIVSETDNNQSFLDTFLFVQKKLNVVHAHLSTAQKNLKGVSIDDLPEQYRDKFFQLKKLLPVALTSLDNLREHEAIITELLGGNGPRKYLFLFQNNHEMRATGGFIGSYGRMDISNGVVKNFFIDGIYNPDGQFKEDIVPPKPLQKITTGWSLHDSNWFAHFPLSAQKAIDFYEKTGGPTVDGVITVTPTMMEKFLTITGPIYMEDYDVILDAENFIELTQQQVEFDYNKEENKPKQILSDLAPIVMKKLFDLGDREKALMLLRVLHEGLSEKHILIYARNEKVQEMIHSRAWDGALHETQRDYLSVVNTNVNGFKTDGMIDESISHTATIQGDGSVINTVKIVRTHNGGHTGRPLWDKVNSNFMRVYVPKGSEFISVEGHTREINDEPVDYNSLGFTRDADVMRQEDVMRVDEASGTRIFEEEEKTVFGNWVYVSPQESVTVTYTYKLPFKVFFNSVLESDQKIGTYSSVFQKQHGSVGSTLHSIIRFPDEYVVAWSTIDGQNNEKYTAKFVEFRDTLKTDQYVGVVLE